MIPTNPTRKRGGVILLAVLVVIALLALIGYGFLGLMNAEFEAVNASNRIAAARSLANSGVDYAAFVLSYPDVAGISDGEGSLLVSPLEIYDNADVFHMRPVPGNGPGGILGYFSIVSPRDIDDPLAGSQGFRFGVEDETAKLNLNALLRVDPTGNLIRDAFLNVPVPGLTEETVDAFLNWMRPEGSGGDSASSDSMYYAGLGYNIKYGPYESLEEALLVRGVTPRYLLGNDRNRNGILEPEEDDADGFLDPGWGSFLTIYSREKNLDSTGQPRIWINDPDLESLYEQINSLLGEDMANFIIGYRLHGDPPPPAMEQMAINALAGGIDLQALRALRSESEDIEIGELDREMLNFEGRGKTINSLFDLVDAYFEIGSSRSRGSRSRTSIEFFSDESETVVEGGTVFLFTLTTTQPSQSVRFVSPMSTENADVMREKLPLLLDYFTTTQEMELVPRINVNTAVVEALSALPGIVEEDLQKVLDTRPQPGMNPAAAEIYRTPAWLVTEAGLEPTTVRQFEPFITTRSQVYRMQVVGYYELGGPTVRVEAVVDANYGRPRVLYWRDITDLGRGFDFTAYQP